MLGQWEEAAKDLHLASKLDYDEEISAVLKKVSLSLYPSGLSSNCSLLFLVFFAFIYHLSYMDKFVAFCLYLSFIV